MAEKLISFTINGEFVTQNARDDVADGNFKKAMKFVMACTETDQLSHREHEHLAYDILNGSADIVGTYPGDDYGVEDYDGERNGTHIGDCFENLQKRIEKLSKEKDALQERYDFVMEYVMDNAYSMYEDIMDELECESCSSNNKTLSDRLLAEYLETAKRDADDDYGWLSPTGRFYPVPWGEHDNWAADYLEEHFPRTKYPEMYHHVFPNQGDQPIEGRDVLTYKLGWALVHSPTQGLGRIQTVGKPLTNHQNKFMFNYYMERGKKLEAEKYITEN